MEDTLMKVYTTLIATLLIIALMAPTVSTQTERKIDYVQMVEDIEIMCRIIDKNMKELFPKASHRTGILGRRGCQGFYLKNYGVIFTLEVQFPVTQKEIAVAPKKKQNADLWQELEREVRHLPHQEDAPPVRQQGKKYDSKKIDKLKERLTYIIGEYSQRIDQLAPNEKISIVVNSRSEHLFNNVSPSALHRSLLGDNYKDLLSLLAESDVAIAKVPIMHRDPAGNWVALHVELEAAGKELETLRKEYDQLRSSPSTTMILTFNENTLRDATGSDWKQILASADIVQY
jgi:hypothetical protein